MLATTKSAKNKTLNTLTSARAPTLLSASSNSQDAHYLQKDSHESRTPIKARISVEKGEGVLEWFRYPDFDAFLALKRNRENNTKHADTERKMDRKNTAVHVKLLHRRDLFSFFLTALTSADKRRNNVCGA